MELYTHRGDAHREEGAGTQESCLWAGGGDALEGEREREGEGEGSGGQEREDAHSLYLIHSLKIYIDRDE